MLAREFPRENKTDMYASCLQAKYESMLIYVDLVVRLATDQPCNNYTIATRHLALINLRGKQPQLYVIFFVREIHF